VLLQLSAKQEGSMLPTRFALHVAATAAFALPTTAALAAPTELYGKSIVVRWTEEREQRLVGQGDFQSRSFSGGLSIYIGTEGHVFNRQSMATPEGRRGLKATRTVEGSADQVGSGGNSSVSFQGHAMTAVAMAQHGAQLVKVTFDPSFSSCTAEVIRGKQEGANAMVQNSLIRPGTQVEIRSSHTSAASCTIQNGNVFAGQ
jgi:hypothetical protein